MKSPEEIKMGLDFDIGCCSKCHECYSVDSPYGCEDRAHQIAVAEDALEYIRQLEEQVGKDKRRRRDSMLIVFAVLIGNGILRIAEMGGDLPLWIDCLIVGFYSAVASILLLKWKVR